MKSAIIFHGAEGMPGDNWFPWLKGELEKKGYTVHVPQFPSPPDVPAKIAEWWRVLSSFKVDEHAILVGHELGGVFALRILEKLDKPITGTFLVGTPIGEKPIKNYDRDLAFSGFMFSWLKIRKNSKRFAVFHSDNDPYVTLKNGEVLAESLGVELDLIPNAGNFDASSGCLEFPQLLEKILNP